MKTDVLTLTVTLIFMYKISVAPQARVVPKAFNDNIRRIHALVKRQCIKVLTPPSPDPAFLRMPGSRDPFLMEKLGSATFC